MVTLRHAHDSLQLQLSKLWLVHYVGSRGFPMCPIAYLIAIISPDIGRSYLSPVMYGNKQTKRNNTKMCVDDYNTKRCWLPVGSSCACVFSAMGWPW